MNYFEFKKILDADPYSKDPDFLKAKTNDPRCLKAYQQAMNKEQVIKDALNIPVPKFEIEHIKFRQAQDKHNSYRQQFLAIAASAVLMVGAGLFFLNDNQSTELEKFINEALMMEPTVYMSEAEIPHNELEPLFASINTSLNGDLGDVHFMKLCPTLNGKGARMVLMNDLNQPITVLYMPNSPVDEAINMQMDGLKGKIVALEQGSAAIISKPHESTAQIESALINSLKRIN